MKPVEHSRDIRPLTRAELSSHVDAFVQIAADVPGEYWDAEHFLAERPSKWALSLAAWADDSPIAYAIMSERGAGHAHLHHFMVASANRGSGLGRDLAVRMIGHAKASGYRQLTLKVASDNAGAIRFYERLGFVKETKEDDRVWYGLDLDTVGAVA